MLCRGSFLCDVLISWFCVLCCIFWFPCPLVSLVLSMSPVYSPCCSSSPSVCQCFLLCASPRVTSPGLLPPLSPHLFPVLSSVSVYTLCLPSCVCPFIASVCVMSFQSSFCFPSPHGMCSLDFDSCIFIFIFLFELGFLFALCLACLALVATLLFVPFCLFFGTWLPWSLYRSALKIKLTFCISLILPPVWVTVSGSTSYFPHPRDTLQSQRWHRCRHSHLILDKKANKHICVTLFIKVDLISVS